MHDALILVAPTHAQLTTENNPLSSSGQHRNGGSCNVEFNSNQSSTGTFASPLYPEHYPADIECTYLLIGRQRERVQLAFNSFELNYALGDPRDPHT
jgi:hypothetical protein